MSKKIKQQLFLDDASRLRMLEAVTRGAQSH